MLISGICVLAALCAAIGFVGALVVPGALPWQPQVYLYAAPVTVLAIVIAWAYQSMCSFLQRDIYFESSFVTRTQPPADLRQSARDSWTAAGVVGGLSFATVAGVLQADPGDHGYETLHRVWYVGFLWLAGGWSIVSIAHAFLSLLYTNALSDEDAAQFVQTNSIAVAGPTSSIAIAAFCTICAANCWIYEVMGLVSGTVANISWPVPFVLVVRHWYALSLWKATTVSKKGPQPQAPAPARRHERASPTPSGAGPQSL